MNKEIVAVTAAKISPYAIPGTYVPVKHVEQAACNAWNININDLYKRTRKRQIVEARQAVISYFNEELGYSLNYIERKTGFDHSTVIYAKKKVRDLLDSDRSFRTKHAKFINTIKS